MRLLLVLLLSGCSFTLTPDELSPGNKHCAEHGGVEKFLGNFFIGAFVSEARCNDGVKVDWLRERGKP